MQQENFTITEVYVIADRDPKDNSEGAWGILTPGGWMPLIAADKARLSRIIPAADKMAKEHGKQYRVLRFSGREDVTDEIKKEFSLFG